MCASAHAAARALALDLALARLMVVLADGGAAATSAVASFVDMLAEGVVAAALGSAFHAHEVVLLDVQAFLGNHSRTDSAFRLVTHTKSSLCARE